ncbi:MAG: collagen-like protein [Deltaproteobacteria bacterium]|nr:collagen-like protein [Deltaproteobacteria bacterium]
MFRRLRRLTISAGCTLALAACAGDAGPKGDTGPKGEPGAKGADGTDGMNGDDGTNGADGADGANGADGTNGTNGAPGPQGPAGPVIVLSTEAKRGLEISPVAINTSSVAASDWEKVGRGSYLVNAIGDCVGCHGTPQVAGPPLFLGGGVQFPLPGGGLVYARNLTPDAQTGLTLTEDEFVTALQTGEDFKTGHSGELLIVMPWFNFRFLAESDLRAIYAYLRVIPAVANPVPDDAKGAFAALGPIPLPATYNEGEVERALPEGRDPGNVQRGLAISALAHPAGIDSWGSTETSMYGRGSYLVSMGSCNDCHTNPERDFAPGPSFLKITTAAYLTGGRVFEAPPGLDRLFGYNRAAAKNLVGAVHGELGSFSNFLAVATSGMLMHEGGRHVAWPMPDVMGNLTIEDLEAIYFYLANLPAPAGASDKVIAGPVYRCDTTADCPNGSTCFNYNGPYGPTGECQATCANDADCGVCQECSAGRCAQVADLPTCVAAGL